MRTLNNLYAEAEKLGSQSYIEGCLACLTAYTVFLCMETHYEKVRGSSPAQKSTCGSLYLKAFPNVLDLQGKITASTVIDVLLVVIFYYLSISKVPEDVKYSHIILIIRKVHPLPLLLLHFSQSMC